MIERYTRPEMGKVWTRENRYKAWLEVELAVCEAWADEGRIPRSAVGNIRNRAVIDVDRIDAIEDVTRHDVIAFLTALEEKIGAEARFIHLGCTSSDIVDTANALLIRQAGKILLSDMDNLLASLRRAAEKYKDVPCMGRTHGVHAEPVTFGLKLAGFYAEFRRDRARLKNALDMLETGKISGAVGTYAFLSPELEQNALSRLGLRPDEHSTQIIQRDRLAELFCVMAIIGGSIERLAVELRHLQRTEVLEAEEGFGQGQKGSSAMPHKKNPISAENLCGASRLLRSYALSSLEDQALWHERDISHSSVERVIMPDGTILLDYALARLTRLIDGLTAHQDKMQANMDISMGLYFSQRVLTALIDAGMPRQSAYETVQRLAMESWNKKLPFPELVEGDRKIASHLPEEKLREIFDPAFYLRYVDAIFDRVFGEGNNNERPNSGA